MTGRAAGGEGDVALTARARRRSPRSTAPALRRAVARRPGRRPTCRGRAGRHRRGRTPRPRRRRRGSWTQRQVVVARQLGHAPLGRLAQARPRRPRPAPRRAARGARDARAACRGRRARRRRTPSTARSTWPPCPAWHVASGLAGRRSTAVPIVAAWCTRMRRSRSSGRRCSIASRDEEFDVLVIGGGITGCRGRPRRRHPRASHRARRARRLRVGHVVEELQARARRSALPAAGRRATRVPGAPRTPAAAPQRPAPGRRAAVPGPGAHQGRPGLEEDRQGDALGAVDVRPHRAASGSGKLHQPARRRASRSPTARRCPPSGCRRASSTTTPPPTTPG